VVAPPPDGFLVITEEILCSFGRAFRVHAFSPLSVVSVSNGQFLGGTGANGIRYSGYFVERRIANGLSRGQIAFGRGYRGKGVGPRIVFAVYYPVFRGYPRFARYVAIIVVIDGFRRCGYKVAVQVIGDSGEPVEVVVRENFFLLRKVILPVGEVSQAVETVGHVPDPVVEHTLYFTATVVDEHCIVTAQVHGGVLAQGVLGLGFP